MKIFSNIKKYWTITYTLAIADFKMKDQGTFLGFIWTLLHPLLYFVVLFNLFKNWMRSIPEFAIYLLIGIVQWNFFSNSTNSSVNSITRGAYYIKNIKFPNETLVFSSVLSVFFCHILELIILIIFIVLVNKKINIFAILLTIFPITFLTLFLSLGISLILATLNVYFLDISRIWSILTNIGFFLTPIFYSLHMLTPSRRKIIMLNPMTHIITATRDLLINKKIAEISGLIYVFCLATIIFIIGYLFFKHNEPSFAEKI